MNASVTPPNHSIPLNKQIYCFQLSRNECFSNLFCAALQHKVVIGQISFPVSAGTHCIQHYPTDSLISFNFRKKTTMTNSFGSNYVKSITTHDAIRLQSHRTHHWWHCRNWWNSARLMLTSSFASIEQIWKRAIRCNVWRGTPATWTMSHGNQVPANSWHRSVTIIRARFEVRRTILKYRPYSDSNRPAWWFAGIPTTPKSYWSPKNVERFTFTILSANKSHCRLRRPKRR